MPCSVGIVISEECEESYPYFTHENLGLGNYNLLQTRLQAESIVRIPLATCCSKHFSLFLSNYEDNQKANYGCCNPIQNHSDRWFDNLTVVSETHEEKFNEEFKTVLRGRQICAKCLVDVNAHLILKIPLEPSSLNEALSNPFSYEKIQRLYARCIIDKSASLESELRLFQAKALHSMLQKLDTIVCLRTNYGKTLPMIAATFIEAKINKNKPLCLIISPLQTLMGDMLRRLAEWNLKGFKLRLTDMKSGKIQLDIDNIDPDQPVYIFSSPEMLKFAETRFFLTNNNTHMICCDECHIAPTWGKHFRKDYSAIHEVRQYIKCGMSLFTATLSIQEKKDAAKCTGLILEKTVEISDSPDRPEIFLISRKRDNFEESFKFLADEINNLGEKAPRTLVFLSSVNKTHLFNLAFREMLVNNGKVFQNERLLGFSSQHFSACTGNVAKGKILHTFSQKDSYLKVLFTTISYGVGIDNKTINRVITWDTDNYASSLWQKISRGCRSGQEGEAIIFCNKKGTKTKSLISAAECIRHSILSKFVGYCTVRESQVNTCCGESSVCSLFKCCSFCRAECKCSSIAENTRMEIE